jgi:hypothetical protein
VATCAVAATAVAVFAQRPQYPTVPKRISSQLLANYAVFHRPRVATDEGNADFGPDKFFARTTGSALEFSRRIQTTSVFKSTLWLVPADSGACLFSRGQYEDATGTCGPLLASDPYASGAATSHRSDGSVDAFGLVLDGVKVVNVTEGGVVHKVPVRDNAYAITLDSAPSSISLVHPTRGTIGIHVSVSD